MEIVAFVEKVTSFGNREITGRTCSHAGRPFRMGRMPSEQPDSATRPVPETTPAARDFQGFGGTPEKTKAPLLPWVVAGAVVVLLALVALFAGRPKSAAPEHAREQDGYAARLDFANLQMSESTSLSGGKSTFIDGEVKNTGDQTVSAVTVQVAFANDEALPAQTITLPLTVIRSREPYVDTQPLSDSPLAPGATREFRLIFEGIGANWNQQLPLIRVTQVFTRCNPCR